MELQKNLAWLCRSNGWLYVVIWGVDRRDHRLLVVEDGYCEQQVKGVVQRMMNMVHMIGKGIVGETVSSGITRWLYHDDYTADLCSAADAIKPDFFKTTVLIPISSSGVAQFGSTRKVPESSSFVDQAKKFFERKELRGELIDVLHGKFPSTSSSGDSYSYCDNISCGSLLGDGMFISASSSGLSPVNIETKKIDHDWRPQSSNMYPQLQTLPLSLNLIGFCNQIQTPLLSPNTTLQSTIVTNVAHCDAQVLFQPSTGLLSPSSYDGSSIPSCLYAGNCIKNSDISVIGKEILSGEGISIFPPQLPANSIFSVHHENMISPFSGNSTSSSTQYGFDNPAPDAGFRDVNKALTTSAEKFPMSQIEPSNAEVAPEDIFDLKQDPAYNLIDFSQQPDLVSNEIIAKGTPGTISASFSTVECDASRNNMASGLSSIDAGHSYKDAVNSQVSGNYDSNNCSLASHSQLVSDRDLFDIMELDFAPSKFLQDYYLDDLEIPNSCPGSSISASECFTDLQKSSFMAEEGSLFSDSGLEQLLNSLAKGNANNAISPSSVTQFSDCQLSNGAPVFKNSFPSARIPLIYDTSLPKCIQNGLEISKREASPKSSPTNMWNVDDRCSMNNGSSVLDQKKKTAETEKVKKRARPGEGSRPRPKDRQQIQDRVKELRDIVPNGKKCSIDSLLNHTIKYMLFMQSVMKYAERLKQADDPKMIVEENGVVLKDNSGRDSSSATWAYEVAGQTMVCPLIVEDLTPPGQMLVEMLCEDHGLFLEIADTIRGFGLTILKGVMEISNQKIWARFFVETNKDVTRMDIFLSLIQLLQQTNSARGSRATTEVLPKETPLFTNNQQPTMSIPVGLCERSQCR